MGSRRVRDLSVLLLLIGLAASLHLTAPSTETSDAALILDRAAALQNARAPGSGDPLWPSSTAWIAYPLAAAQGIAAWSAGAEARAAWLERTAGEWRGALRLLWCLLAAAVILRAAGAWLPERSRAAGLAVAAAALATPALAAGSAHLLPAVPAALLCGELLSASLRSEDGRARRPIVLGALAGMLLAWFPFAWVAVVVALALLLRRRAHAASIAGFAAVAVFLAFALEPARLREPASALARVAGEWRRAGGWSGPGGAGALAFLGLCSALGATGWILWPAAAWSSRAVERRERLFAGAALWVLAVLVPLLSGVRRPGALQWAAAPWLLAWGASGAASLGIFRTRPRLGWAAAGLVLVAGALPARWTAREQAASAERVLSEARAGLAGLLGADDLCVSELPLVAGDSLERKVLHLPEDSREPGRYDFAYWPRWYAGYRWVLLSGGRVRRNLERPSATAPRHFYAEVARQGALEREWGSGETGFRLYRIRETAEWRRPFTQEDLESARGSPAATWFFSQLGDRYLGAGQARAAEAVFRAGLRWDPESPALYSNLGAACLRLEDPAAAARAFEAGLQRAPQSFELLWNLGLACSKAGLHARGEAVLRRVAEMRPEFAPAHYELGRVFLAQGKTELARRALTRSLELDPANPRRAAIEDALARLAPSGGE